MGAERAARVWRLLVVAHPDCPCTAASLENLREIVRRSSRPLSVRVLFVSPHPEETATVSAARSIPGAQIEFERRPDPSRDHGALTSGQTFLFDPQGEVRFSGGVTDGRGAPARSSGAAAIASILVGGADAHAPVYGCALFALEAGR